MDLLLHASWVATVDNENTVINDGCIAIRASEIVAVCRSDEAAEQYSAKEQIQLSGQLLIPGLINGHGHSAMTLLRGFADDLPLMSWLEDHIWPAEGQWVDEQFVRDGTNIAIAEMLRSGTTCFTDMYFFPNIVAETAHNLGVRAQIAFPVVEMPTAWAQSADEYIDKGLQCMDDYKNSAYVQTCFGPHAPYSVSQATLERVALLSDELDAAVHIHAHETQSEIATFVSEKNQRPIEFLHSLGLTSPRLQCAHMCNTQASDHELLAETGSHVVHCPRSNLKLASGFCQTDALINAGVNISLGTDGSASNNSLDMIGEMNSAALLGKAVAMRADAISAKETLRMATINGAKTMGIDSLVGSLEAGKQADIVSIDLNGIETLPVYDPVSNLAYSCGRDNVSNVWVAGKAQLIDKKLTSINTLQLKEIANQWHAKIASNKS